MSTTAAAPDDTFSYEAAMNEVQGITRQLQDGSVSVDDMLQAAARGRHLLARSESKLREVEDGLRETETPSGAQAS